MFSCFHLTFITVADDYIKTLMCPNLWTILSFFVTNFTNSDKVYYFDRFEEALDAIASSLNSFNLFKVSISCMALKTVSS